MANIKYWETWEIDSATRAFSDFAKMFGDMYANISNEQINRLRRLGSSGSAIYQSVYLKTHYWQIIKGYIYEIRGKKCERCGQKYGLNVHHKNYDHIGEEFLHLEDLSLWCRDCHLFYHLQLKDPTIKDFHEEIGWIVECLSEILLLPLEYRKHINFSPYPSCLLSSPHIRPLMYKEKITAWEWRKQLVRHYRKLNLI